MICFCSTDVEAFFLGGKHQFVSKNSRAVTGPLPVSLHSTSPQSFSLLLLGERQTESEMGAAVSPRSKTCVWVCVMLAWGKEGRGCRRFPETERPRLVSQSQVTSLPSGVDLCLEKKQPGRTKMGFLENWLEERSRSAAPPPPASPPAAAFAWKRKNWDGRMTDVFNLYLHKEEAEVEVCVPEWQRWGDGEDL